MSFFITEAETERWLEKETRTLTMPDNSKVTLTDDRLMWRSVDYVTENSDLSEMNLIESALLWTEAEGLEFEITFPNTCVYAHRYLRYLDGIDPKPPEEYVWFPKK